MCMQCVGTAAVVVGSATGIRAVVAAHRPQWLTGQRLKAGTAVLMTGAVLASGISVG
jgi:hypothetical protein